MILRATHTHLYPGHRGTISGLDRLAGLRTGDDCTVEFSDGSAVPGTLRKSDDGWHLHASAYRTAAGTDIAEKAWRIRLEEDDDRVTFRIVGKASG